MMHTKNQRLVFCYYLFQYSDPGLTKNWVKSRDFSVWQRDGCRPSEIRTAVLALEGFKVPNAICGHALSHDIKRSSIGRYSGPVQCRSHVPQKLSEVGKYSSGQFSSNGCFATFLLLEILPLFRVSSNGDACPGHGFNVCLISVTNWRRQIS